MISVGCGRHCTAHVPACGIRASHDLVATRPSMQSTPTLQGRSPGQPSASPPSASNGAAGAIAGTLRASISTAALPPRPPSPSKRERSPPPRRTVHHGSGPSDDLTLTRTRRSTSPSKPGGGGGSGFHVTTRLPADDGPSDERRLPPFMMLHSVPGAAPAVRSATRALVITSKVCSEKGCIGAMHVL